MNGLEGARCVGQGPLFESTHPSDHESAAELCGAGRDSECPALGACAASAAEMNASPLDHRPVGTWAGVLYGGAPNGGRWRAKPREHGTQRGYDQHRHRDERPCVECLTAHYSVLGAWFGVEVS